jgi:hypothetical protein
VRRFVAAARDVNRSEPGPALTDGMNPVTRRQFIRIGGSALGGTA